MVQGGEARGLLYPLLLLLILECPGHGYDLSDRLGCLGITGVEPGHVYRVLRKLERDRMVVSGWVASGAGPARRRYQVTPRGRAELSELMVRLAQLEDVLAASLARWEKACDSSWPAQEAANVAGSGAARAAADLHGTDRGRPGPGR